jgi:hypothetical protein
MDPRAVSGNLVQDGLEAARAELAGLAEAFQGRPCLVVSEMFATPSGVDLRAVAASGIPVSVRVVALGPVPGPQVPVTASLSGAASSGAPCLVRVPFLHARDSVEAALSAVPADAHSRLVFSGPGALMDAGALGRIAEAGSVVCVGGVGLAGFTSEDGFEHVTDDHLGRALREGLQRYPALRFVLSVGLRQRAHFRDAGGFGLARFAAFLARLQALGVPGEKIEEAHSLALRLLTWYVAPAPEEVKIAMAVCDSCGKSMEADSKDWFYKFDFRYCCPKCLSKDKPRWIGMMPTEDKTKGSGFSSSGPSSGWNIRS